MRALSESKIYIFVTFFCMMLYNLCYAKLNNHKITWSFNNIIYILISVILILISVYIDFVGIKIITNFLIFCLELKLIFNDSWKRVITNYILIFVFLEIIELLLTFILLSIGILKDNASANEISIINLYLTFIISFIEYILFSNKTIKKYFQKLINVFIENINLSNIVYLIFITIIFLGTISIKNFEDTKAIQIIIFLFLIFSILFITLIKLKYHEEILKISNKKLIDYNDNYGKFLDDYKIYKHNINHKLTAMKVYGNKKINALIDDLLEEETTFSIKNNELYNIPNGIKGIVAGKLYNKDYNVIIDNNKIKKDPFIKLDAKSFNSISECIGIALDNAIEASEETENPIILIDLKEDKENIYLKIGNNYCNGIDLDNIGNKYYSTKNRGSGLGLFSIKQNNLVTEQIEIINDFYYIKLQIKKTR